MSTLGDLLSCIKKEHSYVVRTEPIKPVRSVTTRRDDDDTAPPGSNRATSACQVCQQNCARYTCPRCSIHYCCLDCYNKHGSNNDGECQESFFRDRTSQHVDLQVKERLDDTKQLIQRMYNNQLAGGTDDSNIASFTQQELLDIMQCLEGGDEGKIQDLLESSKIRQALSDSLGNGELLDYIFDAWSPWWRPELGTREEVLGENAHEVVTGSSLDERILKIPPFLTLLPNPPNLADLRYNLLDILYAVSWTLRLYHGVTNAIENGTDACDTLLKASSVLSKDARWASLSEVLSACTAMSTSSLPRECNASWSCLTNDVALICGNNRYVAKALLEAIDIVKTATAITKETKDKESTTRFRKCRKKLEFFLSWSREAQVAHALERLSPTIETWSVEWRPPEWDDECSSGFRRISTTGTTSLAKNLAPAARANSDHVIREISSRKK